MKSYIQEPIWTFHFKKVSGVSLLWFRTSRILSTILTDTVSMIGKYLSMFWGLIIGCWTLVLIVHQSSPFLKIQAKILKQLLQNSVEKWRFERSPNFGLPTYNLLHTKMLFWHCNINSLKLYFECCVLNYDFEIS